MLPEITKCLFSLSFEIAFSNFFMIYRNEHERLFSQLCSRLFLFCVVRIRFSNTEGVGCNVSVRESTGLARW